MAPSTTSVSSSSNSSTSNIATTMSQTKVFRCKFFVNGDKHFNGIHFLINLDRFRTLDSLCQELSRILIDVKTLPSGVRLIFSTDNGQPVDSMDKFNKNDSYVCSSNEHYIQMDYGNNPTPDPSAINHGNNHGNSVNKFKLNHKTSFNNKKKYDTGQQVNQSTSTNLISSANNRLASSPTNSLSSSNYAYVCALRPKLVALLRGSCRAEPTMRPSRRVFRFLINHRIAQNYEQFLNEISKCVKLNNGAVHNLYGLSNSKKITCLNDLCDEECVYLVYGRSDKCNPYDFRLDEYEQREIVSIVGIGYVNDFLNSISNSDGSDVVENGNKLAIKNKRSVSVRNRTSNSLVYRLRNSNSQKSVRLSDDVKDDNNNSDKSENRMAKRKLQSRSKMILLKHDPENVKLNRFNNLNGKMKPTNNTKACSLPRNFYVNDNGSAVEQNNGNIDDGDDEAIYQEFDSYIDDSLLMNDEQSLADLDNVTLKMTVSVGKSNENLDEFLLENDIKTNQSLTQTDNINKRKRNIATNRKIVLMDRNINRNENRNRKSKHILYEHQNSNNSTTSNTTTTSIMTTTSASSDYSYHQMYSNDNNSNSSLNNGDDANKNSKCDSDTVGNNEDDYESSQSSLLSTSNKTIVTGYNRTKNGSATGIRARSQDRKPNNLSTSSTSSGYGATGSTASTVSNRKVIKHCRIGNSDNSSIRSRNIRLLTRKANKPPMSPDCSSSNSSSSAGAVSNPGQQQSMSTSAKLFQLGPQTKFKPKQEVDDLYFVDKSIGDGKFGVVYTCIHRTSRQSFALKVVDKQTMRQVLGQSNNNDQQDQDVTNCEVAILKRVNHPNIVKLYDHFDYADESYLVLELLQGGDLFDAITAAIKYSEVESASMINDLLKALNYLHNRNIVHRDIKLENLLVSYVPANSQSNSKNFSNRKMFEYRRVIKLADFGLAVEVDSEQKLYTVCGTPTYVAPEILMEIGYSFPVDIWAAGVILYILLSGLPPFVNGENDQVKLFDQIISGKFDFHGQRWRNISPEAKQMIESMLRVEQTERITANELLNHQWLKYYITNHKMIDDDAN